MILMRITVIDEGMNIEGKFQIFIKFQLTFSVEMIEEMKEGRTDVIIDEMTLIEA